MDSHSDPTENLGASLLDGMEDLFYLIIISLFIFLSDSSLFQSANEDINNLISGMKIFYF
jgi:hypothetical protein